MLVLRSTRRLTPHDEGRQLTGSFQGSPHGVTPTPDPASGPAFPRLALRQTELLLVLFAAPLLLFPPLGHPALLLLLFLLPAWWLLAPLPVTPLNGSFLLLLIAVLLSLTASFDIAYSTPKVLGVILGMAMFFAIVRATPSRRSLGIAASGYGLAGGLLAAAGALGTNWMGKVGALQAIAARVPAVIRGVPGQREGFQPNAIAGALLLVIPLQLALALTGRRRVAASFLLAFTSAVFLLTQSRNAWLSLAVAMAAWALWQCRGKVRFALAGIALLVVVAGVGAGLRGGALAGRVIGVGLSSDVEGRLELWARAVSMMEDFPFTGVGMNDFRRVMPAMYPAFLTPPEYDIAHAHNQLLHTGAEMGVLGLVAYLAVLFGVAGLLVQIWRRTENPQLRLMASGLGAGLMAFAGFGMADAIALGAKLGAVFWVALALVVSLHAQTRVSSS